MAGKIRVFRKRVNYNAILTALIAAVGSIVASFKTPRTKTIAVFVIVAIVFLGYATWNSYERLQVKRAKVAEITEGFKDIRLTKLMLDFNNRYGLKTESGRVESGGLLDLFLYNPKSGRVRKVYSLNELGSNVYRIPQEETKILDERILGKLNNLDCGFVPAVYQWNPVGEPVALIPLGQVATIEGHPITKIYGVVLITVSMDRETLLEQCQNMKGYLLPLTLEAKESVQKAFNSSSSE